ncbi:type I DNA topoisomerase [Thermovirga lienii]|uniref:type I DNA topoisomerase n=1 Tax=Thermovirga lienii TaxID=336261 RepID=UPI002FDFAE7C
MSKKVIVVESPTKAKSIYQMLNGRYVVKATLGHIKDLPPDKMGVEVKLDGPSPEVSFELKPLRGKSKVIRELKSACKGADVYIASDPDREGEAIAYHVQQEIKKTANSTSRIRFGAITQEEIQKALRHPDKINMNQVKAQVLRRVLDRIVGYEFSPLVSRNLGQNGCSIGRVQTAALGLIEAREQEITNFVPEPYWHVTLTDEAGTVFQSDKITEKDLAQAVMSAAKASGGIVVSNVTKSTVKEAPPKPLTASTMQQLGNKRFGWDSSKTMSVAQSLFESAHLITYMRTDSVRLSPEEQEKALDYLRKEHPDVVPDKPIQHRNSNKTQDAHECIHPTHMKPEYHPSRMKGKLSEDEWKLYHLIWHHFFASQSKHAVWDTVKVEGYIASSDPKINKIKFVAKGKKLVFEGWRKFLPAKDKGELLKKEYSKGEEVKGKVALEEKETTPPPRYNNASLVAAMEKYGIGRPSTYAAIVSTLKKRKYIQEQKKSYYITPMGKRVLEWAKQAIPEIVDVGFTAKVEEVLDKVELGEADWKKSLAEFYKKVVLAGIERAKRMSRITLSPEEEEILQSIGRQTSKKTKKRNTGTRTKTTAEKTNTKNSIKHKRTTIKTASQKTKGKTVSNKGTTKNSDYSGYTVSKTNREPEAPFFMLGY